MRDSSMRRVMCAAAVAALAAGATALASGPLPPTPPDNSEVHFTIGEAPLLDWLRAGTPYTVTVGTPLVSADLILSDPSELHLRDGKASLSIRVRGRTLPVDQILSPVITLAYDRSANRYFGSFSSLPLALPGLGTIDLKEYVPRFEIPTMLENLWRFSDRPVGLSLRIRRIAILDRALEIGADVTFSPIATVGMHSAR